MKSKKGFTLIELLVVIAIIGMLAGILIPVVSDSLVKADMMKTVANGKGIVEAVIQDTMDGGMWPESGDFSTSTDYFISLVTNDTLTVTYDYFAARDIPPAMSGDQSDFTEKNNAWKVVENVSSTIDTTPFIFTRNYSISSVPTGKGDITDDQLMDNNGRPFGTAGIVVVQKGGAAVKLAKKTLTQQNFNPGGQPRGGVTLSVLAP